MIQTYHQSLVWFRHSISPVTDSMSESYQWLILCLNHTNDWYYVWSIPMTDIMSWFRYIISHCYDSDIISVIGMIQTYYQSLVWFRHIISHWYDSNILSVIDMIQWLIVCLNHASDWYYVWIIPVTDSMSESYQWLILCLNHANDWYYVWSIPMTDIMSES
jgi:hypothetical protein